MRRVFFTVILATNLILNGCSRPDEALPLGSPVVEKSIPQTSEVVEAKNYFNNIPAYEGRRVLLYLNRVYVAPRESARANVVDSGDMRYISPFGYLTIAENILDKWVAAGLDPERQYTVTFGVRAKDVTGGKQAIFSIEADEFIINSDDGFRYGREVSPPKLAENGLPIGRLKSPLPITVKDIRQLELFPEQYRDKLIKVERIVIKESIQSHNDEYLALDSEGSMKFLIKKELVRNDLASWPAIVHMTIAGILKSDEAGTALWGEEIVVFE